MSRTYNSKRNKYHRVKKDAFIIKHLRCWGEELVRNKKDRKQSRIVRARIKIETMKEVEKCIK